MRFGRCAAGALAHAARLGVALLVACKVSPATEIVVAVDSDLEVPGELDSIIIEVESPEGRRQVATASLGDSEPPLPRSLTLLHTQGALGPFLVETTGRKNGEAVVRRQGEVRFRSGESLVLTMHLLRACIARVCADGQSCGATGCGPLEREARAWTGALPMLEDRDGGVLADAGTRNGAVDASAVDASAVDASTEDASPGPLGDAGEVLPEPDAGPCASGCECGAERCIGNCRCDGPCPCTWRCVGGDCTPTCAGEATTCNVGGRGRLDLRCSNGARCRVDATRMARAELSCEPGTTCIVDCRDGERCGLRCERGARCFVACAGADECGFLQCGGRTRMCEGGIQTCGAPCPL